MAGARGSRRLWLVPRPSPCSQPAARRRSDTATDPAASGSAAPAGDASITFIPKQLNNPYTDVVLGGGEAGAKEAGFSAVQVVGPLEASASSQVSFINAETQAGTNVIVIAANDPDAVGPALEEARAGGAKIVAFDSDTNPAYRDVFISQVVAEDVATDPARADLRADRRRG